MSVTLQTLRNTVYGILREEESTSSAYPVSLVDSLINSAYQSVCFGSVINPIALRPELKGAKKGQLPFLFEDYFYSNVASTFLSSDCIIGGSTVDCITDDYPDSGKIYIGGNIITYTGKTSTQFTGCTGILFDHLAGSQVSIVYDLPSDYQSMINVIYNGAYKLQCKLYDDVYEDINNRKGLITNWNNTNGYNPTSYLSPFYTIKDNRYLIVRNLNQTGNSIRLRYEKKPTMLVDATDVCIIDNDVYANNCIPFYAIGLLFYNRGEEQRAAELLNFSVAQIQEMYSYYNNASFENISGTQVRSGKGRLNI